MEGLMAAMEAGALILFFAAIKIYGHYCTSGILKMFWLMMVKTEAKIIVPAAMARISSLKFLWEPLQKMKKQVKMEAEILEDGQEIILMKGGRGGLGNSNFATPTNQAPEHSQPGEPGEEGWKILELKVLADVGLVGFLQTLSNTLRM